MFSCTTIKQISKQKIETIINCKQVDLNSKMIYYKFNIDNVEQNLLFDTGATMSVITDSLAIKDINLKKIGNFGTVTGADKKQIDLKTFTSKIESELFFSENKAFAYIPKAISKCQKKDSFKGILGLDVFFINETSLQLDFSNNKICNLNENEKNQLVKNEYIEVKSECKSKQIFLFLIIDGEEIKFKLDTGFSGTLVMPFSDKRNFNKYSSLVYQGNLFRTASSVTNGEESFYENVPSEFANLKIPTKILVSKTIKAYNMGINYIKAFDWIIDYNNNKVFLKRNKNQLDSLFNAKSFQYLCVEKNSQLVIVTKQKQLNKYSLGDEITSVNNQKVTPENICEMQDLLNKTEDWNTLNLKVITAVK